MSTEVAIPDSAVFQRFLAAADEGQFEQNPEQITIDIIARILNASTVEDVLGTSSATHARDYLDTPFHLLGVRFNQSTYEDAGPDFYALLDAADRDGEKVAISCGARNVIAQAWKLADMGALPIDVQLRQSTKPTSAGFHVMWLEAAPEAF